MQRQEKSDTEVELDPATSRRRKMFNPQRTQELNNSQSDEEENDEEVVAAVLPMLKKLSELGESEEEKDAAVADEIAATLSDKKPGKDDWKLHWGIKCHICAEMFTNKQTFEDHYRELHGRKPTFQCSYCNKIMEHYSTFRSHRYRHITEGRFRCEHCKKGFSVRSLLRVHVLSKHAPVKPYICETCGRAFGTRPGLNLHLEKHQTTSSGGRQWPCELCGKVLLTSSGHKAHMAVHQQGKRFMCELCGKTFTQKVNMQQHFKGHSGEKPYQCDICGKGFAEKSHLNRHHSFHSDARPFRCNVCHKMYKTERCLKVHAMTHAQERPCICTYCGKGFLSNNKLKQHYNIHTGERPYACKFCQRTFTNYPNYLKHTRRRHKQEMAKLGVTPASLVHMQTLVPGTSEQSTLPAVNSGDQFPNEHKLSQGDLAVVAAVAAAAVANGSMQQMSSPPSQSIGMPSVNSSNSNGLIMDESFIKYEPLDMSPLPRDPLDLQDAAAKFPELVAALPAHLHQVNPYHQYQDPFLC